MRIRESEKAEVADSSVAGHTSELGRLDLSRLLVSCSKLPWATAQCAVFLALAGLFSIDAALGESPVYHPYRGYGPAVCDQFCGMGRGLRNIGWSVVDLGYGTVEGIDYGISSACASLYNRKLTESRCLPALPRKWQSPLTQGYDQQTSYGQASAWKTTCASTEVAGQIFVGGASFGTVPLAYGAYTDLNGTTCGAAGEAFPGVALSLLPMRNCNGVVPPRGSWLRPRTVPQFVDEPIVYRVQAPKGEALSGRPAARISSDGISSPNKPVCVGDAEFVATYLMKKPNCEVVGLRLPRATYDSLMNRQSWQPFGDKLKLGTPQRVDTSMPGIGLQLPKDIVRSLSTGIGCGKNTFIPKPVLTRPSFQAAPPNPTIILNPISNLAAPSSPTIILNPTSNLE